MNIYLDIDGVLLINESHASPYADEFLQATLKAFPGTTYWLTTHNWQGQNRAIDVLSPHLRPETVLMLGSIKPTEWNEMKTEGIDFTQPFLWFDDDLWPEEQLELEKHQASDNFILVDLSRNPSQLKDLIGIVQNRDQ